MGNDLISRSALLCVSNVRKVTEFDESGCGIDYRAVPEEAVLNAPAVDAVPVRHGKWIDKTKVIHGLSDYRFDCSECAHIFWTEGMVDFNFCPNCGAKMDGGTNEK